MCRRDNRPFFKMSAPNTHSAEKNHTVTDETQRHETKDTKNVLNAITQTLANHTGVGQHIDYKYNPEITTALEYQVQIGVGMMARGFLTKQWIHALHPSRNPPRVMV